jgi:hypothetical protein
MRALRKEFSILRRKRIVTACAALLFAVTGHAQDTSIRPFMVNVPEEAFVDLRRRLAATRWPSRETVAVVQTAMLAGLPYTALCDAILAHPTNGRGTRLALLECAASVRAIARAKSAIRHAISGRAVRAAIRHPPSVLRKTPSQQ